MNDDDAIGATVERIRGYIVLAITMSARVAEVSAAKRRDMARQAEATSADAARMARMQQQAEVATLHFQARDVSRPDWWETASPAQIGSLYATARSYGEVDPELAGVARYMADEINIRYGVDADHLASEAEQDKGKVAEAVAYVMEADTAERTVASWDDPARREALGARLDRSMPNEPEAVHARMSADAMQGAPVTAATSSPSTGKARIIKPARSPGKSLER